MDTWMQGAPMWAVSLHAYLESINEEAYWIYTWHVQSTKYKSPLTICELSVERPTAQKGKLTIPLYFKLGNINSVVNNVKKQIHWNSLAADNTYYWGKVIAVNAVRKQEKIDGVDPIDNRSSTN